MYQVHPLFSPPPQQATLWRYMDFTKFVSLLDTSSLFFSRADLLGDPFEGVLPKANIETLADRYAPDVADMIRQGLPMLSQFTRGHFVSCWHWSEFESDAMWKIYAQQSAGVSIKTDFAALSKSFVDDQAVYVGRVKYIDYNPDIADYDVNLAPEGNSMGPLLYKRNHFQHEREVRAILGETLTIGHQEPGRNVKVDLHELIREVRVSPLAPPWVSDLVTSVASKYGLHMPVGTSSLADIPLTDQFVANDI